MTDLCDKDFCWADIDLSLPLPGEAVVAEVLKKPSREESARRAICMFSSVKKLPVGELGEVARVTWLSFMLSGGGALDPSDDFGLGGATGGITPLPIIGVSLMIGEYCDIAEPPLKAPGGGALRDGGAAAR